jgi:hypothetical protein
MAVSTRRLFIFAVALLATCAFAAERQEFRYNVVPGARISILNAYGPVTVKPSSGREVIVIASRASNRVEVDASQTGNRVEIRSHILQPGSPEGVRVEYDVQIPADATLITRSSDGPIRAEGLNGDVAAEADSAPIDLRQLGGGHVRVRTVVGPVTLANISKTYLEVTSVGGNVTLNNVTGPTVAVSTTAGTIRYDGDFAGGGDYSFSNHSGDIDVSLPASASVDVTARSVSGTVQNDFPFQPKAHTSFPADSAKGFAGTSNSGASSVKLRSFSGKIRVHKQ